MSQSSSSPSSPPPYQTQHASQPVRSAGTAPRHAPQKAMVGWRTAAASAAFLASASAARAAACPVRTIIAGTLGRMQPRSRAMIVRLTLPLRLSPARLEPQHPLQRRLQRRDLPVEAALPCRHPRPRRRCLLVRQHVEGCREVQSLLELARAELVGCAFDPRRQPAPHVQLPIPDQLRTATQRTSLSGTQSCELRSQGGPPHPCSSSGPSPPSPSPFFSTLQLPQFLR